MLFFLFQKAQPLYPIEVTSDIRDIANWILDVVLDQEVNKQELKSNDGTMVIIPAPEQQVWMNVKKVLECALISKFPLRNVRFGIGRRNNSGSRLSIMEIVSGGNDRQYCPTVFNLSFYNSYFCRNTKTSRCNVWNETS